MSVLPCLPPFYVSLMSYSPYHVGCLMGNDGLTERVKRMTFTNVVGNQGARMGPLDVAEQPVLQLCVAGVLPVSPVL